QSFPNLVNNIYLSSDGDSLILVDCGSGFAEANDQLLPGVTAVSHQFNEAISLAAVTHILITHGHIDHFGGLPFVRQFPNAPAGVHVLDSRVLSNFEER